MPTWSSCHDGRAQTFSLVVKGQYCPAELYLVRSIRYEHIGEIGHPLLTFVIVRCSKLPPVYDLDMNG